MLLVCGGVMRRGLAEIFLTIGIYVIRQDEFQDVLQNVGRS